MLAVVQMDHAINGSYAGLPVLAGVKMAVHSLDDEVCNGCSVSCVATSNCTTLLCFSHALRLFCSLQLKFGVDESYKLTVPATGTPIYAQIEVSKRLALNLNISSIPIVNALLYSQPEHKNMFSELCAATIPSFRWPLDIFSPHSAGPDSFRGAPCFGGNFRMIHDVMQDR
jgi:hypothetical protein